MKNIKLIIAFFIISCLAGLNNINAQTAINSTLLKNKVWVVELPNEKQYSTELVFGDKEYSNTFIFNGERHEKKSSYYLSNITTRSFNSKEKSEHGKYILIDTALKNGEKEVTTFEILELTANSLKLKNLSTQAIITCKSK